MNAAEPSSGGTTYTVVPLIADPGVRGVSSRAKRTFLLDAVEVSAEVMLLIVMRRVD
jgi:hypothetical protein